MDKTILLADDSETIHKVVELTFLDEDYEVHAVNSGEEAIDWLKGRKPDLVIADVHMPPGPSGYEVCERVRELHERVPVLLLAGAFEAFDEDRAKVADAYLKKPFDSQRLLQTAQELMAGQDAETADEPEPAASEPTVDPAAPAADESLARPLADFGDEPPPESAAAAEGAADEASAAAEPAAGEAEGATAPAGLSSADVDAIARRVVELMGDDVVREVAWEVVPDLAEVVVKDRLRELEEPGE